MNRPAFVSSMTIAAASLIVSARADSPQINGISPFGAQRGAATELTISGANLIGNPQLVAPFAFSTETPTAPNADAANWKSKITVAGGTPLGFYVVRVKSDDGVSNPFLFAVGQVPQVAEKEENSTFETAQTVPTPVVVEGQSAGNDVDFFRFTGKKGQRIVVDAQCARIGSGVDPTIRLTTLSRSFVASADDSPGLLTDARLTTTLPEDGDYVVELSDSRYQGGGRPVYRLLIGAIPTADEVYPLGGRRGETVGFELRGGTLPDLRTAAMTLNATPGTDSVRLFTTNQLLGIAGPADPILDLETAALLVVSDLAEFREPADPSAPPLKVSGPAVAINGRIDPVGDEDRFVLAVTPGQGLRIKVVAADSGSALDGQLKVLGANNAVLGQGDDTTRPPVGPGLAGVISPDPSVDLGVPAGLNEVTLVLRDLEGRGGVGFPYRLTVEPITPGFDVILNDAQARVPKDGSVNIGVTIARQGYNGPVALTVLDPPAGVVVRQGAVPEGQGAGVLSLSATADASFGPIVLKVVGQGHGPAGPIVRSAMKTLVFAQQGNLPTNLIPQVGLVSASGMPNPVALVSPNTPIEVVHGYGATFPVKATRAAGADAALSIEPMAPLYPGLAVPAAPIAEKAAEGNVTINAAVEAPLTVMTVGLTAKGKFANVDRTFAVPVVTVTVVRPAALELAAPSTEVKAEAAVEVKGKVVRKGPFKEPVTVRIDGLPAGLKAEPVTVAPEASEFTLKIVAESTAPAATAKANVAMAFKVGGKDYATPPTPLEVKVIPK